MAIGAIKYANVGSGLQTQAQMSGVRRWQIVNDDATSANAPNDALTLTSSNLHWIKVGSGVSQILFRGIAPRAYSPSSWLNALGVTVVVALSEAYPFANDGSVPLLKLAAINITNPFNTGSTLTDSVSMYGKVNALTGLPSLQGGYYALFCVTSAPDADSVSPTTIKPKVQALFC